MCKAKENVAVLFISGQSNAHAHGRKLELSEYIAEPLKNVYALDRDPNQSLELTEVAWSGYTSAGKNLGETQDHTCSFAYCFAKNWQNAIDAGECLPDLYIVQISVGAQGIINGMWNPDKENILIPGDLDVVDISLYPLALRVYELAMSNLKRNGKSPIAIGWHWIGSEQDIREGGYDREDFGKRYDDFFDEMLQAIGDPCPLYLYKLYLEQYCAKKNFPLNGLRAVNDALYRQCERHDHAVFVELERSPHWDAADIHRGVFAEDDAHYLAKVHKWFADEFFEVVRRKYP